MGLGWEPRNGLFPCLKSHPGARSDLREQQWPLSPSLITFALGILTLCCPPRCPKTDFNSPHSQPDFIVPMSFLSPKMGKIKLLHTSAGILHLAGSTGGFLLPNSVCAGHRNSSLDPEFHTQIHWFSQNKQPQGSIDNQESYKTQKSQSQCN